MAGNGFMTKLARTIASVQNPRGQGQTVRISPYVLFVCFLSFIYLFIYLFSTREYNTSAAPTYPDPVLLSLYVTVLNLNFETTVDSRYLELAYLE